MRVQLSPLVYFALVRVCQPIEVERGAGETPGLRLLRSSSMPPSPPPLQVCVTSADLTDDKGRNDAMVLVSMTATQLEDYTGSTPSGIAERSSDYERGTLHPQWDFCPEYDYSAIQSFISFVIKDDQVFGDDFLLGWCSIAMDAAMGTHTLPCGKGSADPRPSHLHVTIGFLFPPPPSPSPAPPPCSTPAVTSTPPTAAAVTTISSTPTVTAATAPGLRHLGGSH